jgi:hypothetical protein
MTKLREAAQAVVKAYLAEPDEDGGYSVLTMREIDALREALAEDRLDEMQSLTESEYREPKIGELEFTFRELGVKIWEQQMVLTPFGEQVLHAAGWRRCAEGQGETQHCGLLEAAVLAEREACISEVRAYSGIHFFDAAQIVEAIRARGRE